MIPAIGDRAACVGDHEVGGRKLALVPVKRDDFLPGAGATDDDPSPVEQ